MSIGRKFGTTMLAALAVSAATAFAALAGGDFADTWEVEDTDGKPFDITLKEDGTATATHSKDMTGTWTAEGNTAVIKWDTGWTTKIIDEGDNVYKKEAFKEDGSPANTSSAKRKE